MKVINKFTTIQFWERTLKYGHMPFKIPTLLWVQPDLCCKCSLMHLTSFIKQYTKHGTIFLDNHPDKREWSPVLE